jgi:hypothetical protein
MATLPSLSRSKVLLLTLAAAGVFALLSGLSRPTIRAGATADAAQEPTAPAGHVPAEPGGSPRVLLAENVQSPGDESAPADAGGASATELQLLRDRVTGLEQQLAQAQSDPNADVLPKLDDQIARARRQLAWQQAEKEARAAEAEGLRADRDQAIGALLDVQQRLAYGDSDVADVLEGASPALPLPAQRDLETARAAIDEEDLYTARYWISVAIAESERTQLRR